MTDDPELSTSNAPLVPSRSQVYALYRWGLISLVCVALLSVIIGRGGLSLSDLGRGLLRGPFDESTESLIMWWIRLPQVCTSILAGASLAVSGAALQSLLRNPLADPYLLGVSSGGGLGAALVISFGWVNIIGLWVLPVSSFLGALGATAWIYQYTRRGVVIDATELILSGVALNLFLSAILTLTLTLSGEKLSGIWRWLLGHLEGLYWTEVGWLCLGVTVGGVIYRHIAEDLRLMEAGEEVAWSLGVDLIRTQQLTLIACALSVGVVVAFCGVIGFIGLMIPHFLRPHLSSQSASLIPLSALYGAVVLCGCDVLSRLTFTPLPVGVVTSTLGGGVFLMTLHQTRRSL